MKGGRASNSDVARQILYGEVLKTGWRKGIYPIRVGKRKFIMIRHLKGGSVFLIKSMLNSEGIKRETVTICEEKISNSFRGGERSHFMNESRKRILRAVSGSQGKTSIRLS